ncbi:MAG: hypothetical protein V8T12_04060 [Parabacteroides johnsonii]
MLKINGTNNKRFYISFCSLMAQKQYKLACASFLGMVVRKTFIQAQVRWAVYI